MDNINMNEIKNPYVLWKKDSNIVNNFTANDAREAMGSYEEYRWQEILRSIYDSARYSHRSNCKFFNLSDEEQKKLVDFGYVVQHTPPDEYIVDWSVALSPKLFSDDDIHHGFKDIK